MSDGRIGNSNQSLQISGVVSAPAYSFASDNDTGIYRIGANNIGIAANGTKVLDISNTAVTITPATTLSAALTYGGVTLSNAVTGTGNMVLSASPTLTGTLTAAAANFSGNVSSATEFRLAQTYLRVATVADAGGWTFGGGYNFAFNSGVGWKHDSTGALSGISFNNAGSIGFFAAGSAAAGTAAAQVATFASNLLTLSKPLNYGGVTLSNAVTGTGSMVLSANQTLTGTTTVAGVRAGNAGSIQQDVNTMYVGANFSSTGTYLNTSFACQNYFDQSDGTFTWRTAASGTAGNAISFSTKAILSNAGNWRWHNYGSGAITSDASGNLTAVSDPAHKTFVRSFTHGLPEIRAIANNDKFMGLHRWNEKSGMEMDGVYASFFAHNDFPVPEAVAKRQEGANTFSDRPVIMALVNAVAELTTRLESLENK